MLNFLTKQGISPRLITDIEKFRQQYPWTDAVRQPVPPKYPYYGKEILEESIAALLAGENLLLTGPKATGKNVLAENLAYIFGRPDWNVSFHINMDASYMIGTDTFSNGEVTFRPGPIHESALKGGFAILDEINMARNEALAVLHSLLDFRRFLDVPGYDRISLHPAARFIATMNYGYAGTRELNEALASRFVVVNMPAPTENDLITMFTNEYPDIEKTLASALAGLFLDLQEKAQQGEISSKPVDLRGLMAVLKLYQQGISIHQALKMGIVNKSFDSDEQEIVEDIIKLRI